VAIAQPGYQKLINDTLGDTKRVQRFVSSITSAVAVNPQLQECDPATILSAALLGEALNLSPSPQLGQYYLVPFEDKKNNRITATFICGWKGYKALAMNSGVYRYIYTIPVKKGELIRYDVFSNVFEARAIEDPLARDLAETVGYYGCYELLNGYKEILYWSKEKMLRHAERYSKAFGPAPAKKTANGKDFPGRVSFAEYEAGNYDKKNEWAYSSFWYKDFDGMANKTILRQLLSKGAPLSTEMRMAYEGDGMTISNNLTPDYLTGGEINDMIIDIADATMDDPPNTSPTPSEVLSIDDIK